MARTQVKTVFSHFLFVFGFICSIFEPFIRSVSDMMLPIQFAVCISHTPMDSFLRENVVLFTFAMSVLLFFTFIVLQRQFGGKENPQWLSSFCTFGLGLLTGFIVLFFALDIFYLRGAFLLLPTAFGFLSSLAPFWSPEGFHIFLENPNP